MNRLFLACLILLGTLMACQSPESSSTTSSTEATAPVGIQEVDVATFKAKMKEDNVVILDVRTPAETAQGKIEGAIELDALAQDFREQVAALDKDKTYLVYCKVGSRSANACRVMEKAGIPRLYNLKGGYTAWTAAGEQ